MKLTLQQINLAMKVYPDLQELLLNADLTFAIDDNYEMLKRKNNVFISKVLQFHNKYSDNKEEFEKHVMDLAAHEIDVPIKKIGTISYFRSIVLSEPSNKLKPNTLNLINFMFDNNENNEGVTNNEYDCKI